MEGILKALEDRKRTAGGRPALSFVGPTLKAAVTWSDYAEAVDREAQGLAAAGGRPGWTVALQLPTSERLFALRLALTQLKATALILSPRLAPSKLRTVLQQCHVHLWVGPGGIQKTARSAQRGTDAGEHPEAIVLSAGRVTGMRKRVALSSENLLFAARSLISAFSISDRDLLLSHLPPSRLAEQLLSIHCAALSGAQVCVAEPGGTLRDRLLSSRPTVLFGPPEMWKGLKAEALLQAQALPESVRGRLERAMAVAQGRATAEQADRKFSTLNELEYRGYVQTVLEPLKARMGLDRCRVALSSGSALGRSLFDFFSGLDLKVREIYGQAEASGLSTCNGLADSRAGSVGRPLLGVEVRIGDGGRIFLRSRGLGRAHPSGGSWGMEDGWLDTGDRGRLDDEGHLFIDPRV